MENPIKLDDLGVPLFSETPIYVMHFPDTKKIFGWSSRVFQDQLKGEIPGVP